MYILPLFLPRAYVALRMKTANFPPEKSVSEVELPLFDGVENAKNHKKTKTNRNENQTHLNLPRAETKPQRASSPWMHRVTEQHTALASKSWPGLVIL